jgi:hypothetical protein
MLSNFEHDISRAAGRNLARVPAVKAVVLAICWHPNAWTRRDPLAQRLGFVNSFPYRIFEDGLQGFVVPVLRNLILHTSELKAAVF